MLTAECHLGVVRTNVYQEPLGKAMSLKYLIKKHLQILFVLVETKGMLLESERVVSTSS